MPGKSAHVKNEKQYEALKEEGNVEGASGEDRELARPRPVTVARSPIPRHRSHRRSRVARPLRRRRLVRKGGKATASKS